MESWETIAWMKKTSYNLLFKKQRMRDDIKNNMRKFKRRLTTDTGKILKRNRIY